MLKNLNYESPRKVISYEIKIKLTGKRLYPSNSVKYPDVRIDRLLHWHVQRNDIAMKLKWANALLLKIRKWVILHLPIPQLVFH